MHTSPDQHSTTDPNSSADNNAASDPQSSVDHLSSSSEHSSADQSASSSEHSSSNEWSPAPDVDAVTFWNNRYGERDRIWSGRVNPILAREASTLTPGTALDLGCGEGADAIWLAAAGWQVTAVDVAETALARAREHATAAGVADRIVWEQHDLAKSFPAGSFDLVSAQFLHSPVEMPRGEILRTAAAAIASGGSLLVVGHYGMPPGSTPPNDTSQTDAKHSGDEHHHAGAVDSAHPGDEQQDAEQHDAEQHHPDQHADMDLPTPDEVLADLNLPVGEWEVVVSELVDRTATGADGVTRDLTDSILRVRRR